MEEADPADGAGGGLELEGGGVELADLVVGGGGVGVGVEFAAVDEVGADVGGGGALVVNDAADGVGCGEVLEFEHGGCGDMGAEDDDLGGEP